MKNIVILGCESIHARIFLEHIKFGSAFSSLNVIGVFSENDAAAEELSLKFGIKKMQSFDEAAGEADGVIITARDGALHYKYAKPYIKKGVSMLIDKPITQSEEDAKTFASALSLAGVKALGGSSLKYHDTVLRLKQERKARDGQILGGTVCAPIITSSEYGGFFFYAQHLVDTVIEIFGHPSDVTATKENDKIKVNFIYESFSVCGVYTEDHHFYSAEVRTADGTFGEEIVIDSLKPLLYRQLSDFTEVINGRSEGYSLSELFFPVSVMNSIFRALR